MENIFVKYLRDRYREDMERSMFSGPKPVVTISRECGCPSKIIARMLVDELNRRPDMQGKQKWNHVSREILQESSAKLELDTKKVKNILAIEGKGIMEDVFASFSSHYISNLRAKKTFIEVVRSFADEGHIIIVGLGGVAITRNHPDSLHIRLEAPLEWRVKEFAGHREIPVEEARKIILETDRNRTRLIESFLSRKPDNTIFDVIFNSESLTKADIVETTIRLMESKKMV
jgi:cytidylate kinase